MDGNSYIKGKYLIIILTSLIISLIGFLSDSPVCFCESKQENNVEEAVSRYLGSSKEGSAYMEQFIRLLPFAYGIEDSAFSGLTTNDLISKLRALNILPPNITLYTEEPMRKGKIALVMVKSLSINNASLVERLLINLFSSETASYRAASRAKLAPRGGPGDIVTIRELAAIFIAITVRTEFRPLPISDTKIIGRFARAILKDIISVEEVKVILELKDSNSIDTMLAM